jgi:hypothetical protein
MLTHSFHWASVKQRKLLLLMAVRKTWTTLSIEQLGRGRYF